MLREDSAATVVVDAHKLIDCSVPKVAQLHGIEDAYLATLGIPVVVERNFVGNYAVP